MFENENQNYQPQNESLNRINPGKGSSSVGFFAFLFDLVKTFVVVMLIAFAIRYFIIQPFVVDGDSMLPTFINSEYLIAEKISYDFASPTRGDIVIFRYPKNPSIIYIKRVIGTPGETVEIKDGKIYISGTEISEKYLGPGTKTNLFESSLESKSLKTALKADEFFVLGDNRDHSSDSREWGVLPKSNIIGKVWLTVTPLDRFKVWTQQKY